MFLQRHGESETNVSNVFTCRDLDPNLTEKGRLQIEQKADLFKSKNIKRIISSPSKRAVQTADIISSRLNLRFKIHKALLEVDLGDLEGESAHDQMNLKVFFGIIENWIAGHGDDSYPGGESKQDIEKRIRSCIHLLEPSTLFIGHATFFALLLWKLNMPFSDVRDLFLPHAGTAHFDKNNNQWCII